MIKERIELIESKLKSMTVSSFVTMTHVKIDAVKIANYFRNKKYKCKIEDVNGLSRITITKQ